MPVATLRKIVGIAPDVGTQRRQNRPDGTQKLWLFQGLRALAAICVVFDHAIETLVSRGLPLTDLLPTAYFLGEFGVRIFFALSGYIMIHTTRNVPSGGSSALNFMLRRVLRIVPLYWLATAIYAAKLTIEGSAPGLNAIILSLLLVPQFSVFGTIAPIYGLGWTLSYEMYFYLALALALTLFGPRWRGVVASGLIAALFVVAGVLSRPAGSPAIVGFLSNGIVFYFVLGIGAALLQPVSGASRIGLALSILGAVIVLVGIGKGALLTNDLGVAALTTGLLVSAAHLSDRWAPQKRAVLLGDASYSIYLFHSFVIGPLGSLIAARTPWLPATIAIVLMVAVAVSISLLVYLFVERSIINWSRNLTAGPKPRAA